VVNAGVPGDTSRSALSRLNHWLDPDIEVLILEMGANDIASGLSVSEMKKNLGRFIQRTKSNGATLLLAVIQPPSDWDQQLAGEISRTFQALIEEHDLPHIPSFFGYAHGVPALTQSDGIHPNRHGAKVIAENVHRHT
jgi:acyl-CoA thioesterase-1